MNHYAGDNSFWHHIGTAYQQFFRFRGITPFQANDCVDAAVHQSLLVMIPINFPLYQRFNTVATLVGTQNLGFY